jgi:hypothetical protein
MRRRLIKLMNRSHHGVEKKVERAKVQQVGKQAGEECDASAEKRHAQARQVRARRQGKEPQAGNRHRSLGGAEEGRQSAAEEEEQPEAEQPQEEAALIV